MSNISTILFGLTLKHMYLILVAVIPYTTYEMKLIGLAYASIVVSSNDTLYFFSDIKEFFCVHLCLKKDQGHQPLEGQ